MNHKTQQETTVSHDQIAQLARQTWSDEGCQEGRDVEYWLRAEQELMARRQPVTDPIPQPEVKRKQPSARGKRALRM